MDHEGVSSEWAAMWQPMDSFIMNSIGQDCEGNPIIDHIFGCMLECFKNEACVGFSRKKAIGYWDLDECWLKTNIELNKIPNDPTWYTVFFNPKF